MQESHQSGGTRAPSVVVGLDGSANSERALRAAMKIAKGHDMQLRLVGVFASLVVTDAYFVPMMSEYLDAAVTETQQMLRRCAAQAERGGIEVSAQAVEGDPAETLVNESRRAHLMVVGKRGSNRFAGRLMGSVSSKLAAHGHCPTLVIPEAWQESPTEGPFAPQQDLSEGDAAAEEPLSPIEESNPRAHERWDYANVERALNFDSEVVVGVDVSDSATKVLNAAAEAAAFLNRPLTLVSAAPIHAESRWFTNTGEHNMQIPQLRQSYIDQLRESASHIAAAWPGVAVRWQFFDGTAAGVLSEASRTAALIVLGTRGHGGFTGLLLGSVSQAVLSRSVSPVLVVPTRRH